ncbi:winged helix-turn-helix transcriptional regulator [Saccharopolyspora sp. NPDC002376]
MPGEQVNTEARGQSAGPGARVPDCPLARTVGIVGHWWTLEILHEVFEGHTRFGSIRLNLALPADVLRERIADLVARGLLETADRTADSGDREYRPTDLGRALRPLVLVMAAYGNHRLAQEERSLVLVDVNTGAAVDPVVVDRRTGRPIDTADHVFACGPRASDALIDRYPTIAQQ